MDPRGIPLLHAVAIGRHYDDVLKIRRGRAPACLGGQVGAHPTPLRGVELGQVQELHARARGAGRLEVRIALRYESIACRDSVRSAATRAVVKVGRRGAHYALMYAGTVALVRVGAGSDAPVVGPRRRGARC